MRRFLAVIAVVALAGCLNATDNGSPTIPDGVPVYRLVPSMLQYSFRDTTAGQNLSLRWLSAPPVGYTGWNCIGLQPNSQGDTVGTFAFAWIGPNTGWIERNGFGTIDTTQGYFFPERGSDQGTHGTYVAESNHVLTLHWVDGFQSRYFQPGASLQLVNDTIIADVDMKTRGDSVREQWHVVWAFEGLNGC